MFDLFEFDPFCCTSVSWPIIKLSPKIPDLNCCLKTKYEKLDMLHVYIVRSTLDDVFHGIVYTVPLRPTGVSVILGLSPSFLCGFIPFFCLCQHNFLHCEQALYAKCIDNSFLHGIAVISNS